MTCRRSAALLQATILSPEPFSAAMVVMRETVPVPAATLAIIWPAAVMLALVHPAGMDCSQETYTVFPAGTGLEPCAQAPAAEPVVVVQRPRSVDWLSMIGRAGLQG